MALFKVISKWSTPYSLFDRSVENIEADSKEEALKKLGLDRPLIPMGERIGNIGLHFIAVATSIKEVPS